MQMVAPWAWSSESSFITASSLLFQAQLVVAVETSQIRQDHALARLEALRHLGFANGGCADPNADPSGARALRVEPK